MRYQEYVSDEEVCFGNKELELKEGICIKNLRFAYPNSNRLALNISSLYMKAGSIVGLLGVNGSGKTTLIYILSRIINKGYCGEVKIDENFISEYSIRSYQNKSYVLSQKPLILEGSLRENVILFDEHISNKEILESKYSKLIYSLIERLPMGLDSQISDTGNNLSVGEKQKIALVRMFLQKPQILFLDEPFTGLDIESQQLLNELLHEYKIKNNALIIIASHQGLETEIVDQKIVLS